MFYHYRAYRAAGSVVSSLVGCAMFSVLVVFGLAIGCVAERMAAVAWAARAGRRVEEKGNLPKKTWPGSKRFGRPAWLPCTCSGIWVSRR